MINPQEVADVINEQEVLDMFPVLVQAVYNSMVILNSVIENRYNVGDDERYKTLWDLRNVNTMLHDLGIHPTYKKRREDDGSFSLKHIDSVVTDQLIDEYKKEADRKFKQFYNERMLQVVDLRKQVDFYKFQLNLTRKYGRDKVQIREYDPNYKKDKQ